MPPLKDFWSFFRVDLQTNYLQRFIWRDQQMFAECRCHKNYDYEVRLRGRRDTAYCAGSVIARYSILDQAAVGLAGLIADYVSKEPGVSPHDNGILR